MATKNTVPAKSTTTTTKRAAKRVESKICRVCGVDKPLVDYRAKSSRPDGRDTLCAECARAWLANRKNIAKPVAKSTTKRASKPAAKPVAKSTTTKPATKRASTTKPATPAIPAREAAARARDAKPKVAKVA